MTDFKPRTDLHALKERTVDEAINGVQPYHKESYLRELYNEKEWTQEEIADFYNVDVSTICRWMDKNGIDTRPSANERERDNGQEREV